MVSILDLCWVLFLQFAFVQICCPHLVDSQPFDYPTANLSTSWINSPSAPHSVDFTDSSTLRAILVRGTLGPRYACGFFCNGTCDTYLFAIFIVQTNSISSITSPNIGFPQVVWSANRNNEVRINATLRLTSEGDLVLRDIDGTVAWSTNTSGKSVAGLNLTELGNLVLYDVNNATVWQSFDHPTDSLVPGQKLVSGQKLTSSVSATNWTEAGLYSLSVTSEGLFALIGSNPPQVYHETLISGTKKSKEPSYIKYLNGSLALYILNAEPSDPDEVISVPYILNGEPSAPWESSAQYMKLGPDGHLRVYEWNISQGWMEVGDLWGYLGKCDYPMVCGEYGICTYGQCSCPQLVNETNYFRQIDGRQPDLGCSLIDPLNCALSSYHSFLGLMDIAYFTFSPYMVPPDIVDTDVDTCKQACLKNCSCKAALFRDSLNSSNVDCYLPSQIFSLMNNDKEKTHYNSSVFIKVQTLPVTVHPPKKTGRVAVIVGSSVGSFGLLLIIGLLLACISKKNREANEDDENYLDQVPGMPERFSYEDLKVATENFSRILGAGGFGSVFEGTLVNGMKVAVKRLDGLGHIKKLFLAEVETIGSIHHVNLVRLIGFCAEKSYRLLVYELMVNGSLEKWIFHKNHDLELNWQHRRKIILDIAKGLAYLHEDCRQKIIHLDIKPQNILLDDNFNAKVSDFGLSKLVDRDQSQVMTTMRGTPGYLAPEWLSSVITEKVDVYSYGVVVLEILCGRKNLDRSQPEDHMHLLSLFKRNVEEDQLLDMVDKNSEDMQSHGAEIVEMMRVAAWCLQSDFSKRPSMSVVVKVLEGVMEVEHDLDYSFSHALPPKIKPEAGQSEVQFGASIPLLPSVLSGPR